LLPKLRNIKLRPAQAIIVGFLLLILTGAAVLSLPISTHPDKHISFFNAFFTSTSAVCVTGLVVVDTGSTFTLFGQIVILVLIQTGGLGFMTITSLAFILIRKRITLSERLIIKESLNEFDLSGMVRMVIRILKVTFVAELAGAAILAARFVPMFGLKGIYFSVFHAVSAFCNAGFDVFGLAGESFAGQSLFPFQSDPVIVLTISILVVIGGLGFVVITNIMNPERIKQHIRISRHSRLVLISTGILIAAGFLLVYLFESANPKTLGTMDTGGKIMNSLFQAVTPRTAGFNTIKQNSLMPVTKMLVMIFMFIGASPAGTGGGIKTTTAALVLMNVFSFLRGHKDVNTMKRRVASETLRKSMIIFILSLLLVAAASLAVTGIEQNRGGLFTPQNIFFEVMSAFGTVGLSCGLTPVLSAASRLIIMFVMFSGRVGLMTFIFALAYRQQSNGNIRFPEERFMVG
jgi:trk system potassium uptake protein TrkH